MGKARLVTEEGKDKIINGNSLSYIISEDSCHVVKEEKRSDKLLFKKEFYPKNADESNAKQIFYITDKFILRKESDGKGGFTEEPKVYTSSTIKLATLLLKEDIVTLGDKPRQQQSNMDIMENAYCWTDKETKEQHSDIFWIDTTKLTKSPWVEEIVKALVPTLEMYYGREKWDVCIAPANAGIGLAQAIASNYNSTPVDGVIDPSKAKRNGYVTKDDKPESLKSILNANDRILLTDDAFGVGDTMRWAYPAVETGEGEKKRKIIGYFVVIDAMRRRNGIYLKETLAEEKGIKGESAIQVADLIDILYIKRNELFSDLNWDRNKYSEKIIDDVKKNFEEHYRFAKNNCENKLTE